MARTHDTCPLADFQRDLPELVESFKESGRPTVLTRDGKPELVVQSAEAYQELIDLVERAEALLAVEEGLESIERGEGRPLSEVMDSMRAWIREGAP
jgi:PHD/YefM family antitoxin component YafN of YafNO toxin-antitoxin module